MSSNDWLDIEMLDDYLEGKLDASTMHKVERVSLEDPFVAQALAGLTEVKKRTQTLSLLQKQLQERIAEKPIKRKAMRMTSHRLSIAAAAAVLFITASVLFLMKENMRRNEAAKAAKSIEVMLKPVEEMSAAKNVAAAELPAPKEGWSAYEAYLKENNKLFAKGEKSVQLNFTILNDGSVAAITIIEGLAPAQNNEAVRLLNEGPKWNYDSGSSNKGAIFIKF